MKRDFLNERGYFETRVERKMGGGDLIKDRFTQARKKKMMVAGEEQSERL